MEDILFITAYKDIGRMRWKHLSRTNDEYFSKFVSITKQIQHTLIVFVEEDIHQQLKTKYTFSDNIIFCDFPKGELFYNNFLESQRQIIESREYQEKIPMERKTVPEHIYAEYNLINHSKINFVRQAKKLFSNYSFYSWIDFGFGKVLEDLPIKIPNINRLPRRIIYHSLTPIPETQISPNDMLSENRIFLIGSSYIIPNELVEIFENIYEKKIIELEKEKVVDDDQNIVYQIYMENKEIFALVGGGHWFSFYNIIISLLN
jgi:hypothetical protein